MRRLQRRFCDTQPVDNQALDLPVDPEDWQALNVTRTRFGAAGYEVASCGQGVWRAANGGPGAPPLRRWHFFGVYTTERAMLEAATTALHRYCMQLLTSMHRDD